jgi:biotin carboxyl carrier protein
MRLKIDGKEFCVSILPDKKGYKVRVGNRQIETSHSSPQFRVGRQKHTAEVKKKADNTFNVSIDQDNYSVEILDKEKESSRSIKAPMQGTVIEIDVKEGQAVQKGQTIIKLISMKMENEIKAERDCRIREIKVRNRQTVAKGEVLIELEKP